MNFYAFSALVVCLSCLVSGLFVFWKNPRGKKNLNFLPFPISGTFWSFFYMLWQMSTNAQDALLWIRLSMVFAALLPVTNFNAIVKLLDVDTPGLRLLRKILYGITAVILLFGFTSYFIPRVEPRGGFPFWPVPGFLFHVHSINLFIPSFAVLYLIWREKEKASPLQKNKLKWLLYGTLVGYAGGMSNDFLWYNIPIKPYISILSCLVPVMTGITFFRPAVVDFNYLIRKTFTLIFQFLFMGGVVFLALSPFQNRWDPLVLILLAGIMGALVHSLALKVFRSSSTLVKTNREKIKESTYTYIDLAQNIVDLTMSTIPVQMVAVYFFDIAKRDFYLCAQKGMKNDLVGNLRYNRSALAIPMDDPLLGRLGSIRKNVSKEQLLNDLKGVEDQPVIDTMTRLEAEICEPFIFGEKLRGLMVIGRKQDNSLFNDDELDMIQSYAQMGTEIMRTIMAMETELNQTALYSHDINHDIRSITQTLQFLRSPFARSQPEEKLQALLEQGESVAERLYDWFQHNKDRSAMIMKTIRGEYEKKPVSLSEIVKISTGKFSLQAQNSHVEYAVDVLPTDKTSLGNEADLIRVIDNLISNGLRHLPETNGRLSILGNSQDGNYLISIKDNGEGVNPDDLDRIWQFGWQGQDSKKGSTGFGLAIVKQIVQIHGGTIQAFSEGKGKGTEFKIVLPLKES